MLEVFQKKPTLILLDGRGHVNVVLEVLSEKNLNIPVVGLVKNDKHKTKGIIYDDTYIELM